MTLNPYDDIFPRNQKTAQKRHTPDVEKKKKKPVQNRNLLSFDDELDEEEFAIPATTVLALHIDFCINLEKENTECPRFE